MSCELISVRKWDWDQTDQSCVFAVDFHQLQEIFGEEYVGAFSMASLYGVEEIKTALLVAKGLLLEP